MTADLVLAIDEGTSSARAIAYDESWTAVATASRRLTTDHPRPGWAEQDPAAILAAVVDVVSDVLDTVGGAARIAAAGIANQGETVVAWDRDTGAPIAPAILWSCRRSQAIVDRVAASGHGPEIQRLTGLPLDPYFSASKIRWLIEEVPEVSSAAANGRLAVGTVDAWLTARLGKAPTTDPSTASRTQLLDLSSLSWDDWLLSTWDVPRDALPEICPTVGPLGTLAHERWDGQLPLRALVCDQQAALAGQAGHRPGATKATFGTGVFVLANVGPAAPDPPPGILATVAWTDPTGRPTYALDGGAFSAGALLDWLHDDLGLLDEPEALDRIAREVDDAGGVRILPALSGLGAPWWQPNARVVIAGMSAATQRGHVARAAIDAIAHRTADIVEAMEPSLDIRGPLRVDGGLTGSRLLVQRVADLTGRPVEVAQAAESTALGTGLLAAIGADRITERQAIDASVTDHAVEPRLDQPSRRTDRDGWSSFVRGAIALEPSSATAS